MKLEKISFWQVLAALLAVSLGNSFAAISAETNFSGITEYVFEPNPQEISPKMYNWEVKLNKADSQNGAYEIVQITKPRKADSNFMSGTRSQSRIWGDGGTLASPSYFLAEELGKESRPGLFSRAPRWIRSPNPSREHSYQTAGSI
jgi:hypothetical protein